MKKIIYFNKINFQSCSPSPSSVFSPNTKCPTEPTKTYISLQLFTVQIRFSEIFISMILSEKLKDAPQVLLKLCHLTTRSPMRLCFTESGLFPPSGSALPRPCVTISPRRAPVHFVCTSFLSFPQLFFSFSASFNLPPVCSDRGGEYIF